MLDFTLAKAMARLTAVELQYWTLDDVRHFLGVLSTRKVGEASVPAWTRFRELAEKNLSRIQILLEAEANGIGAPRLSLTVDKNACATVVIKCPPQHLKLVRS